MGWFQQLRLISKYQIPVVNCSLLEKNMEGAIREFRGKDGKVRLRFLARARRTNWSFVLRPFLNPLCIGVMIWFTSM